MKLTPKQENLAQKFLELGNGSEAYRQSYNTSNMSEKTIHEKACIELKKGKVAARVRELQKEHAARHAVTVDSITREYEEARQLALEEKQTSAAVSATTGKAKLHGLLNDKVDLGGDINITVTKKVFSARDSD